TTLLDQQRRGSIGELSLQPAEVVAAHGGAVSLLGALDPQLVQPERFIGRRGRGGGASQAGNEAAGGALRHLAPVRRQLALQLAQTSEQLQHALRLVALHRRRPQRQRPECPGGCGGGETARRGPGTEPRARGLRHLQPLLELARERAGQPGPVWRASAGRRAGHAEAPQQLEEALGGAAEGGLGPGATERVIHVVCVAEKCDSERSSDLYRCAYEP